MPQSPGRGQRWTVGELLRWTTERFGWVGIATPRVDAEHLLAHALGCRRVELYLQHDRLLGEDERRGFRELVRRRLTREPVAYIEGIRGFHALDLDLMVDGRVLIPRPETEHLVDWIVESLPDECGNESLVDVGTGSGAIALALKHARPELRVTGVDVSEDALTVARANAERHQLDVRWQRANLLEGVIAPDLGWTVIAANLPYIPSADMGGLEPEVRDHEPPLALDGGDDGLDLVRALIAQIAEKSVLAPGGAVYLEIGIGQAAATQQLLEDAGFLGIERREDLSGIERVVRATVAS